MTSQSAPNIVCDMLLDLVAERRAWLTIGMGVVALGVLVVLFVRRMRGTRDQA